MDLKAIQSCRRFVRPGTLSGNRGTAVRWLTFAPEPSRAALSTAISPTLFFHFFRVSGIRWRMFNKDALSKHLIEPPGGPWLIAPHTDVDKPMVYSLFPIQPPLATHLFPAVIRLHRRNEIEAAEVLNGTPRGTSTQPGKSYVTIAMVKKPSKTGPAGSPPTHHETRRLTMRKHRR